MTNIAIGQSVENALKILRQIQSAIASSERKMSSSIVEKRCKIKQIKEQRSDFNSRRNWLLGRLLKTLPRNRDERRKNEFDRKINVIEASLVALRHERDSAFAQRKRVRNEIIRLIEIRRSLQQVSPVQPYVDPDVTQIILNMQRLAAVKDRNTDEIANQASNLVNKCDLWIRKNTQPDLFGVIDS